jgi:hypothetical protein
VGSKKKSIHPAIEAVRRVISRYPPKSLQPEIIAALGDQFDEGRMSECYKSWLRRGYNPAGWAWLSEWYVTGIPEKNSGRMDTSGKHRESNEERKIRENREWMESLTDQDSG